MSALGPECVDGNAVAKLFECDGQCGGCPTLVVVHREAIRVDIGGRSGGIEQDEDAEVASELAAVKVDVFGWRVAGAQIDEQSDERFDVEFVAIGAAAQNHGAQTDPRQASPEHIVVRNTGVGDVCGDSERKVDDSTPLGSVPVVVYVPLRVERTAHAEGSAGLAVIGEVDSPRERPGVGWRRAHSANGADRCLRAGGTIPRRAPAAEESAQKVR